MDFSLIKEINKNLPFALEEERSAWCWTTAHWATVTEKIRLLLRNKMWHPLVSYMNGLNTAADDAIFSGGWGVASQFCWYVILLFLLFLCLVEYDIVIVAFLYRVSVVRSENSFLFISLTMRRLPHCFCSVWQKKKKEKEERKNALKCTKACLFSTKIFETKSKQNKSIF